MTEHQLQWLWELWASDLDPREEEEQDPIIDR